MNTLHPRTADLVDRFADALKEKLAAAEQKYGHRDGWADPGWMDECRRALADHIAKGDPRDVAAYCAFLWHHGEPTHRPKPPLPATTLPEPVIQALRFYASGEHYSIDNDRFDTVSDEPQNWLCSLADDDATMIEDGAIARAALRGEPLEWIDGGEDTQPAPIEGEVFRSLPASPAAPGT